MSLFPYSSGWIPNYPFVIGEKLFAYEATLSPRCLLLPLPHHLPNNFSSPQISTTMFSMRDGDMSAPTRLLGKSPPGGNHRLRRGYQMFAGWQHLANDLSSFVGPGWVLLFAMRSPLSFHLICTSVRTADTLLLLIFVSLTPSFGRGMPPSNSIRGVRNGLFMIIYHGTLSPYWVIPRRPRFHFNDQLLRPPMISPDRAPR